MTQQVKDHNAAVMATAFVKAQIPQDRDPVLDEVRDALRGYYRLSEQEWHIDCSVEEEEGGFRARLMHRTKGIGIWECVNTSVGVYPTEEKARDLTGPRLPVVAIKWGDQMVWPYMDIRKEHAMADARKRRERRATGSIGEGL